MASSLATKQVHSNVTELWKMIFLSCGNATLDWSKIWDLASCIICSSLRKAALTKFEKNHVRGKEGLIKEKWWNSWAVPSGRGVKNNSGWITQWVGVVNQGGFCTACKHYSTLLKCENADTSIGESYFCSLISCRLSAKRIHIANLPIKPLERKVAR